MKAFQQNKKRKARTQDPSVAERNRERGKENRRQEDEERQRLTEQRRPYSELSILDLRNLMQRKTGKRTLKRSRDALLDIIWNADYGGQCQSSGAALNDFTFFNLLREQKVIFRTEVTTKTRCVFTILI